MSDYSLPKQERLSSLTAIRRLFSEGRSGFVYPFRYLYLACPAADDQGFVEGDLQAMFSVPKKFHKRANKRNLLKRRTREAFRLHCQLLRSTTQQRGISVDLAFVLSTKDVVSYKTIEYAVKRILEQVQENL